MDKKEAVYFVERYVLTTYSEAFFILLQVVFSSPVTKAAVMKIDGYVYSPTKWFFFS